MSKLTVLVTTMHQTDAALYKRMNLQTDAVIANQASDNWERTEQIDGNMVKVVTTDTRGLSKNRNIALAHTDAAAKYLMFSDDDLCFYDGYEQTVLSAFEEFPDADAIKFNLRCVSERQLSMATITAAHRVNRREVTAWGVCVLAVKADVLRQADLRFNERFGTGTPNYCGEDSIFLQELFKKRRKVYAHPAVIADIDQAESSWFEGWNEKYFVVKGMVLSEMYPFLCYPLAVRSAYRFSKRDNCTLPFFKILKCYFRGIKQNEAERRISKSVGHQP